MWSGANQKQMGRFATAIRAHLMKLPTLLMLVAVTYRLDLRSDSEISKAVVIIVIAGEMKDEETLVLVHVLLADAQVFDASTSCKCVPALAGCLCW